MPDPWGLEEKEPEKKKKKEELILDFDMLKSEYERQSHRAQNDIDQRFVTVGPVVSALSGDPTDVKNLGLIGKIREDIRTHVLTRTTYGMRVVDALEKIETLSGWSVLYAKQMESYIEAFQFYCKSAFSIIDGKNKRVGELEEAQIKKIPRTRDEVIIAVYNRFKNEGITPSLRAIAEIVTKQGFEVSYRTVKTVLDRMKPETEGVKQPSQEFTAKPEIPKTKDVKEVTNQEKKQEEQPSAEQKKE